MRALWRIWFPVALAITMLPFLSKFIAWLNDQPQGTQGLVFLALTILCSVAGTIAVWLVPLAWRASKRQYRRWQEARERALPTEDELGVYDHGDRINLPGVASQSYARRCMAA